MCTFVSSASLALLLVAAAAFLGLSDAQQQMFDGPVCWSERHKFNKLKNNEYCAMWICHMKTSSNSDTKFGVLLKNDDSFRDYEIKCNIPKGTAEITDWNNKKYTAKLFGDNHRVAFKVIGRDDRLDVKFGDQQLDSFPRNDEFRFRVTEGGFPGHFDAAQEKK